MLLVLALLASGLGGCDEILLFPQPDERIRIAFGEDVSEWLRADWTLVAAQVADDTVEIDVRFSGGCRDHRFWLLAVDDWIEIPAAGPLETRAVPLLLAHDDRGDACEAVVTRSLRFSLDPLRSAHRTRYGSGTARLFLRMPQAQGSAEVRTLEWLVDG